MISKHDDRRARSMTQGERETEEVGTLIGILFFVILFLCSYPLWNK